MHSYKNKSDGGSGMGDSGPHYVKIGENKAHVPPAGASNSYEQVRKSLDAKDRSAMGKMHYSREKMRNK